MYFIVVHVYFIVVHVYFIVVHVSCFEEPCNNVVVNCMYLCVTVCNIDTCLENTPYRSFGKQT